MPKGIFAVFISAGLILAGCGGASTPSANTVQTAIAQTAVAAPKNTTAPSATSIPPTVNTRPTETAIPTATNPPTSTPVPPTPTQTSTPDLRSAFSISDSLSMNVLTNYLETGTNLSIVLNKALLNAPNWRVSLDDLDKIENSINKAVEDLAILRSQKPPPAQSNAYAKTILYLSSEIALSKIILPRIRNGTYDAETHLGMGEEISRQRDAAYSAAAELMEKYRPSPGYAPSDTFPNVPPAIGTQTVLSINATATAVSRNYLSLEIAKYKPIDAKELINYPDRHSGEMVKVSGRVFNVVKSADDIQMDIAGTYDAVYVSFRERLDGVYKDDAVTVYGTISDDGFKCFKNSLGGDICQPHLINAFTAPGVAPASSAPSGNAGGGSVAPTAAPAKPVVNSGRSCPTNQVCITAPVSGLVVPGGVNVTFIGTANAPNFARYQFLARDANGSAFGHIADFKTAVTSGKLMDFYTGSVPPGMYVIRLQVIDSSGNIFPEKAEVVLTIQ